MHYQFIRTEVTTEHYWLTVAKESGMSINKPVYLIKNKKSGDILLLAGYYWRWRQYTTVNDLLGDAFTILSASCHRDIADFLQNHAGKD